MPYAEPSTSADRRAEASKALRELLEGNQRFAAGGLLDNKLNASDRRASADEQHPKAVVIGCVDSRVPPEIVLGQGVGDLLTVRTAGQSLSGVALGSIEFGICSLGVPLMVVLGHTNCGAVLAAIRDDDITGHLGELIGEVAARLVDVVGDDPIKATGGNLKATVAALRELGTLVYEGHPAHVVGLLYDVHSGRVEVTDDGGLLSD